MEIRSKRSPFSVPPHLQISLPLTCHQHLRLFPHYRIWSEHATDFEYDRRCFIDGAHITFLGKLGPGDVVLVRSPESPRKTLTRRILGMEGDTVTFLVDPANSDPSLTLQVPKGHVWIQGDNIYASRDSRYLGLIPYGLIQSKVFWRVWPPRDFGTLE